MYHSLYVRLKGVETTRKDASTADSTQATWLLVILLFPYFYNSLHVWLNTRGGDDKERCTHRRFNKGFVTLGRLFRPTGWPLRRGFSCIVEPRVGRGPAVSLKASTTPASEYLPQNMGTWVHWCSKANQTPKSSHDIHTYFQLLLHIAATHVLSGFRTSGWSDWGRQLRGARSCDSLGQKLDPAGRKKGAKPIQKEVQNRDEKRYNRAEQSRPRG